MLYYFGSKEMAQRMVDLGEETQKGVIDLRTVEKLTVSKDHGDVAINVLVTSGRTYHFTGADHTVLAYWMEVLTTCCPTLARERLSSSFNGANPLETDFGSIAAAEKGKTEEERR